MADILIRGIEMPTKCGLCPMFCDDFNDYCSAAQRSIPFDAEKPEWCPFVPLPAGHGRLIDADELKTAFPCGESVRTECVRATIDHALTIVPAEGGGEDG